MCTAPRPAQGISRGGGGKGGCGFSLASLLFRLSWSTSGSGGRPVLDLTARVPNIAIHNRLLSSATV